MTWTKLDDGFWMHPKILVAGNTAAGVFARMLSYCGCYMTDGAVPNGVVATIVGSDKKVLPDLESAGLIQLLPTGGAIIPDYLDYNRSRLHIEQDREQRAANGRKGGRPRQAA